MKNLLTATDLSARADRALERAVRVAEARGAALTVIHVLDDGLRLAEADTRRAAAERAIRDHVGSLAATGGLLIAIEIVGGKKDAAVLDLAAKIDPDLVVLGVHREDALKDMFRGKTVERVIRSVNAPVLVVRDRVAGPYKRAMIAVDFSAFAKRAVEYAAAFVEGGAFHLVHAYHIPFKGLADNRIAAATQHDKQYRAAAEAEMAAFLAGLDVPGTDFDVTLRQGPVRQVIDQEFARINPDLLVIGTHGRTGMTHAFLGSVAEDLLCHPHADVLAVKAR